MNWICSIQNMNWICYFTSIFQIRYGKPRLSPVYMANALFKWWPPPKRLFPFLLHNTGQDSTLQLRKNRAPRGKKPLVERHLLYEQPETSECVLGKQTCFSSQTSDAWQWHLSSTSVQVQPAFVYRPPPWTLFHTVGRFTLASELCGISLARVENCLKQ